MSGRTQNILVLGCARSGTTLLYDILSHHADMAWISNAADRVPQMPVAHVLQRLRSSTLPVRRRRLMPCEGHRTWRWIAGDGSEEHVPHRTARDASDAQRQRADRTVTHCRQRGQGSIFLNKNTALNRQVGWAATMLDDLQLVHVIRHPREVIASLVGVRFWPDVKLWTRDFQTPQQLAQDRMDNLRLAAQLWRAETMAVLNDACKLGAACTRISYDDLIAEPVSTTAQLCEQLGIRQDDAMLRRVRAINFHGGGRTGVIVSDDEWAELRDEVSDALAQIADYRP